jgi:hypothetical protein
MKELTLPPAAVRDNDSIEMMRVWIAERGLHCSLNIGRYLSSNGTSEEKAWGIILADAARHISNAISQTDSSSSSECLSKIRGFFLDELAKPTSVVKGDFVADQTGVKNT